MKQISFPLGGVAAGSIGLGGRGDLRDWQIFNRADRGNSPAYAFGALWVKAGSAPPVTRILESNFEPPLDGPRGLGAVNAPGLPRFGGAEFRAEYPIAEVHFEDAAVPIRVKLTAFSPIIPLDAEESGLPLAILRYELWNAGAAPARTTIAFSIENPVGVAGRRNAAFRIPGLSMLEMTNPTLDPADPHFGSFALSALEQAGVTAAIQTGWDGHNRWRTGIQQFWDQFSKDGTLPASAQAAAPTGSAALSCTIPPAGRQTLTFLLTWHFPNRTPARCGWEAPPGQENTIIGNHYCARFRDAREAAQYAAPRLDKLEAETRAFLTAMQSSTVPTEVREAALANLSTLATPACFRTANGSFYGFEGCNEQSGAWFGNCTHVWNYETATAYLFPSLSRSMRDSAFGFSTDDQGRMEMRTLLPGGKLRFPYSAADGQMGQIVHLYLDWRISGDPELLRRNWEAAKRALEFAWIPGGWDADQDGVMEGVQHNTYDIEFYGPNPLCSVMYLAALRAAAEMARANGDESSAAKYQLLYARGSHWIDANLFNGDYYVHQVRGRAREAIAKGLLSGLGPADTEHPDMQPGSGCLTDQLLGQCLAHLAGLGPLLDRKNIKRALESILKYNFKPRLSSVEAVDRVFAVNDEAGTVLCQNPVDRTAADRFPRFQEVWAGVEYALAALLLFEGMTEPALKIIRSVRARYDGERRNPWGEIEAGWNYVRSLASWSCFIAASGFDYDAPAQVIRITPNPARARFRCAWFTANAWGVFAISATAHGRQLQVRVERGQLECRSVLVYGKRIDFAQARLISVGHELNLDF